MPSIETRRGRPRKFAAPSRPVTVTLPEAVIDALHSVDADLGRAIVRVTQRTPAARRGRSPATAEVTQFGRHAVIVVNPTPSLAARAGVELVPLPDGRALIAFEQPRTIAELELALEDALEEPGLSKADGATFRTVLSILKEARRSNDVALLQRSIIVLESRKKAPRRTTR